MKPEITVANSDGRSVFVFLSPGPIFTFVGATASIESATIKSPMRVRMETTRMIFGVGQSVRTANNKKTVTPPITELKRIAIHQIREKRFIAILDPPAN